MASIDATVGEPKLERRARWAYERARIARALIGFAPLLLVVALVLALGGSPIVAGVIGGGLYLLGAFLLWYGREPSLAVLPGVLAGLVPLCLSLCVNQLGHVCMAGGCVSLCMPACTVGGVTAGFLVARAGLRGKRGPWFWITATVITGLTASLGCSCVGYSSFVGMGLGYAIGVLPGALKALQTR